MIKKILFMLILLGNVAYAVLGNTDADARSKAQEELRNRAINVLLRTKEEMELYFDEELLIFPMRLQQILTLFQKLRGFLEKTSPSTFSGKTAAERRMIKDFVEVDTQRIENLVNLSTDLVKTKDQMQEWWRTSGKKLSQRTLESLNQYLSLISRRAPQTFLNTVTRGLKNAYTAVKEKMDETIHPVESFQRKMLKTSAADLQKELKLLEVEVKKKVKEEPAVDGSIKEEALKTVEFFKELLRRFEVSQRSFENVDDAQLKANFEEEKEALQKKKDVVEKMLNDAQQELEPGKSSVSEAQRKSLKESIENLKNEERLPDDPSSIKIASLIDTKQKELETIDSRIKKEDSLLWNNIKKIKKHFFSLVNDYLWIANLEPTVDKTTNKVKDNKSALKEEKAIKEQEKNNKNMKRDTIDHLRKLLDQAEEWKKKSLSAKDGEKYEETLKLLWETSWKLLGHVADGADKKMKEDIEEMLTDVSLKENDVKQFFHRDRATREKEISACRNQSWGSWLSGKLSDQRADNTCFYEAKVVNQKIIDILKTFLSTIEEKKSDTSLLGRVYSKATSFLKGKEA